MSKTILLSILASLFTVACSDTDADGRPIIGGPSTAFSGDTGGSSSGGGKDGGGDDGDGEDTGGAGPGSPESCTGTYADSADQSALTYDATLGAYVLPLPLGLATGTAVSACVETEAAGAYLELVDTTVTLAIGQVNEDVQGTIGVQPYHEWRVVLPENETFVLHFSPAL